jgi:hypothetical protein
VIKLFEQRQVREAKAHAASGGQALHLFIWNGKKHGHLLDQDRGRLVEAARRFGVRSVFIHNADRPEQHVDLWGQPLLLAVKEAVKTGGV